MVEILEGSFYNPSRGSLTYPETIGEILHYMLEKPDKLYDVIVGCDSSSEEEPSFPIAIVVLRQGEGGRFFLKRIRAVSLGRKFQHWKTRILQEVMLSCELALSLKENLEEAAAKLPQKPNYQFRYIHADVGESGATKDMIREVVGLIRGNGFEAQIKPYSYAASVVADRFS